LRRAGARAAWNRHWIGIGFGAIEARLAYRRAPRHRRPYYPLVPQVYNARRASLDLAPYPAIAAADGGPRAGCLRGGAAPEAQPDAP